jgi:hypothetical protein
MTFAYADPPYIGQAKKHYDKEEVDHIELMRSLEEYDGWALSASSPSLGFLIREANILASKKLRIGIWAKPFCSFKKNVNPAYAWEPVIFSGGRKRGSEKPTLRDWIAENITLQKGLSGAKPKLFSYWVFEMLGMEPEDKFADIYPGTGAVTEAWNSWKKLKANRKDICSMFSYKRIGATQERGTL